MRRPSGIEVLEAALELDEIDPYVKERIGMALKILRQLEGPQFKVNSVQGQGQEEEGPRDGRGGHQRAVTSGTGSATASDGS